MKRLLFLLLIACCQADLVVAQDMQYIRQCLKALASPGFGGRGYVGNSRDKAARFLTRNYAEIGLEAFDAYPNYEQVYNFPVNTFPTRVELTIGKKQLKPGVDFIVAASSSSFATGKAQRIHHINLDKVESDAEWEAQLKVFKPGEVYLLRHFDSLSQQLKTPSRDLLRQLPGACFIIPQSQKLIWTVSTDTIQAAVYFVADTAMPRGRKASVFVHNKYLKDAPSKNILAYVRGAVSPDTFIVFTAHYDHLGKMGAKAVFAGANDNASGTAFLLGLAKYFVANPSRYSIAFMAFSGEEAGLLGSGFYVEHPVIPHSSIKCLVNIDLMGDATDGITMVNATNQMPIYERFVALNEKLGLLPKVQQRDNAPNSDHYPFTQQNVPAVFIYANGGKGFYHDVFDVPKEISFHKIPQVFQLITHFVDAYQNP